MSYTDKSSINDNHCNLNVTILYCALPDFCFLYFFFTCLIFMYSTIEYMNQKKNYPSFVAVFLNSMTPVSGGRPCLVAAAIRRVSSNEWPVTGTFKHLRKKVQSNLHYRSPLNSGHLSTTANFLVDSPYIDSGLNLAVADPGKGSGGPGSPPYFSTKMRPEGPKKCSPLHFPKHREEWGKKPITRILW